MAVTDYEIVVRFQRDDRTVLVEHVFPDFLNENVNHPIYCIVDRRERRTQQRLVNAVLPVWPRNG